jgi:hypothetical protein
MSIAFYEISNFINFGVDHLKNDLLTLKIIKQAAITGKLI